MRGSSEDDAEERLLLIFDSVIDEEDTEDMYDD
jgi:hypothetical protein